MTVQRTFLRDGAPVAVVAEPVGGDHWRVRVGETSYEFRVAPLGDGGVRLVPVGAEAAPACVAYGVPVGKSLMVRVGGRTFTLESPDGRRGAARAGDGIVRAPMTGTVLAVSCREGETVEADQTLVVLSAMKMEHKLAAGVAGVVRRLGASVGMSVGQGEVLVEVEPAAEGAP